MRVHAARTNMQAPEENKKPDENESDPNENCPNPDQNGPTVTLTKTSQTHENESCFRCSTHLRRPAVSTALRHAPRFPSRPRASQGY